MELITKNDEQITTFFQALEEIAVSVEKVTESCKPLLNGEHYLTDREVSGKLKVSKRTLQEYRNQGKIAYIQLGGKILYRESDIENMLNDNYYKAWE